MANVSRIQAFKDEMAALLEKYQVTVEIVEDGSGYVHGLEFTIGGFTNSTGEHIRYEDFDLNGRTFTADDFK